MNVLRASPAASRTALFSYNKCRVVYNTEHSSGGLLRTYILTKSLYQGISYMEIYIMEMLYIFIYIYISKGSEDILL